MSFSVGVIHYRDPDGVVALAESTRSWDRQPRVFVVADNSGEFEDPAQAARLGEGAVVLQMGANLGYAGALNRIAAHLAAEGIDDALLVLTQDARLEPDAVGLLADTLATDERAVLTLPFIAYASDHAKVFSAGGYITRHGITDHVGRDQPVSSIDRTVAPYDVQWGDGAVLMLDLAALTSVGGLDEAYFLYVEEVDLQHRLRAAGGRVLLVPAAMAYQEPGPYSLYYGYRNLSYFTAKFADDFKAFPWWLVWWKDAAQMWLRDRRWDEPLWALRGILDFRRHRMGTPRPRSLRSSL